MKPEGQGKGAESSHFERLSIANMFVCVYVCIFTSESLMGT